MNIEVIAVEAKHKSVLRQLTELCNYDFSEYLQNDIDEHGYYNYSHLDNYWTDETRYPFFIKVNGNLAGFVLVYSLCEYISNIKMHIALLNSLL